MNLDHIAPLQETGEQDKCFHITDEASANWLLRKLANLESEKARVQTQAAQICKQLDQDAEWLKQLYEGELVDFARRTLTDQGRGRRTLHLLQGSIALRLVSSSVRVSDP